MRDLQSIQAFCQTLAGTTEDIKWEHNLVFSVAEKMYALVSLDDNPPRLCFRAGPEMFEVLTQREGIEPAPYLARYKWVVMRDLAALPADETKDLLTASYEMTVAKLPKKVRDALKEG